LTISNQNIFIFSRKYVCMAKPYLKEVLLILMISIPGCTLQDEPMFNGTILRFSGNALVATDDYLYVGAETTRCVDWDGNIIWETKVQGGLKMVLAKDVLFLSTYEYKKSSGIALLDFHGKILWQKELGTAPVERLDASNDLLVAGISERLWAFSRNGDSLWEYTHSSSITGIAVAPDSSCVAFIDCFGFVCCLENGHLVWSQSTRKSPTSLCTFPQHVALAFAPDSSYIAYGSEGDPAVVVVTPKGEEVWSHPVSECPLSAVITADSQYIIVGSPERLYKFALDGTLLWTAELPGNVNHLAVTPGGEYIAAGCDIRNGVVGFFVVFNSDGAIFWKTKTSDIFRGVALHPDGAFAAFTIFRVNVHIFHNPPTPN
jgi:WD40 repeat protein